MTDSTDGSARTEADLDDQAEFYDYENQPDYDYPDDRNEDADDDAYYDRQEARGTYRYSQGFGDGFDYAMRLHPTMRMRLKHLKNNLRQKVWKLRWKLRPIWRKIHPPAYDDIPF